MHVIRIVKKEADVEVCSDCPYFNPDKEFTICDLLDDNGVKFPDTIIQPGRKRMIDEKCPLPEQTETKE